MYKVLEKKRLNSQNVSLSVHAPMVARNAKPGQFIILRVNETGERVPFTIAESNKEDGSVKIAFQIVGKTTKLLSELNEGDTILDFAGPLGKPSELSGLKKVCVIGGGLGCAIAYPQAKYLHDIGAKVDVIAGFRNEELIFFEDELRGASENLYIMTDDGSNGNKGLVTDKLKELLDSGNEYDAVIAIGPLIMMKFVCKTTLPYNLHTIVSLNPIMIDGTGMCGGCRVTVGGEVKFACVHGPEFDGHQVDFDEVIRRSSIYKEHETEKFHKCKLEGMSDA